MPLQALAYLHDAWHPEHYNASLSLPIWQQRSVFENLRFQGGAQIGLQGNGLAIRRSVRQYDTQASTATNEISRRSTCNLRDSGYKCTWRSQTKSFLYEDVKIDCYEERNKSNTMRPEAIIALALGLPSLLISAAAAIIALLTFLGTRRSSSIPGFPETFLLRHEHFHRSSTAELEPLSEESE
ncbi:hypothetical protein HYFRA_00008975 [Hymenoscyphus fraxineus]|uniref:Uncharacterized protein n=1 Tax=Hymenoscyphus fraxineus TaxID=746836 RepID=A0A9N9PMU0_9HELO|nr:hypothetical protein HYFRA_00008975 [Hymenoscyphus fraxineus]